MVATFLKEEMGGLDDGWRDSCIFAFFSNERNNVFCYYVGEESVL